MFEIAYKNRFIPSMCVILEKTYKYCDCFDKQIVSLSYFKDLLYKILIYFYKDFFGKVKNGQKKCPNLEN
jgi:hypothetical protein